LFFPDEDVTSSSERRFAPLRGILLNWGIPAVSTSEEIVTLNPVRAVLCACVIACIPGWAQEPGAQTVPEPAAQPPVEETKPAAAAAIPPPKEIPSEVNTGRGFSIQPIYWLGRMDVNLRTGDRFTDQPTSGDLNIPSSKPRVVGGVVGIPAGKTSMVRFSYIQMPRQSTGVTAPGDLTLFSAGTAKTGDVIFIDTQVTNLKVSFDYLTYFFKRGNTEFRVKTLWEMQRVGVTTDMIVFAEQDDDTVLPLAAGRDFNILLPTVGVGLEHTVGRRFRWEARASGMTLGGRKSAMADGDVNAAVRMGRFEFVAGGRFLYFRGSRKSEHVINGNMYGPYVGLRFYWRKERPTAAASAPTSAGPTR